MVVSSLPCIATKNPYLVHASVGKKQGGVIVGDGRGTGHKGVLVLVAKVRDEGLADVDSSPMVWAEGHSNCVNLKRGDKE
jgi:hypothetical protein